MAKTVFLPTENLDAWIKALAADRSVLAPVRDREAVVFGPVNNASAIELDQQAAESPKKAIFPQTEDLMRFKRVKTPDEPETLGLELEETIPTDKTVVFGARPCGIRGFAMFDRVYANDRVTDPYYKARRDNTHFVTIACADPMNSCFCHWVGSGPADDDGTDVLLVPVEGGYAARAVTKEGEAILELAQTETKKGVKGEADAVAKAAREKLGDAPNIGEVPGKIMEAFDDIEFWTEMTAACVSCGACTYLCPTCYCFNITDESRGLSGKRIRTWDNCMSHSYTQEASGHNPRPTKAHRMRNRVGHKFGYYPNLHEGTILCCGCGRCISRCPNSVDIRRIVMRVKER